MKKRQQKKDRRPFKIKTTLPEQKTVDIKKNEIITETIPVDEKQNISLTEMLETLNLYFLY